MINRIKRILAVLALCCAAVFIGAVVVLGFTGQLEAQRVWVYGPLCVFLMLGLAALLINWLQKKAAEQAKKDQP